MPTRMAAGWRVIVPMCVSTYVVARACSGRRPVSSAAVTPAKEDSGASACRLLSTVISALLAASGCVAAITGGIGVWRPIGQLWRSDQFDGVGCSHGRIVANALDSEERIPKILASGSAAKRHALFCREQRRRTAGGRSAAGAQRGRCLRRCGLTVPAARSRREQAERPSLACMLLEVPGPHESRRVHHRGLPLWAQIASRGRRPRRRRTRHTPRGSRRAWVRRRPRPHCPARRRPEAAGPGNQSAGTPAANVATSRWSRVNAW
jgi:hypothetical protein